MPLYSGITCAAIVEAIPKRVTAYNYANPHYNTAYAAFSVGRAAGISKFGSLEGWLASPAAGPCIAGLLRAYGMDSRNSRLVQMSDFSRSLSDLTKTINIQLISNLKIPTGGLGNSILNTNPETEIRALFNYCSEPGTFSESGGFVIGSKTAHCILPDLCPMLDGKHIAISLYNVPVSEYHPPGNDWIAFLGRPAVDKVNPSPQGAGRNSWDSYRYTQAIAVIERIYSDWQLSNGNPGFSAFLELDPVKGTTGIPRAL